MRMLKRSMIIAAINIFWAGVAQAASDTVILKVEHYLPPSSTFHQKNLIPWCEKINKESNRRLKCQIYPSMQLGGTPAQLFDQMRDGVADIVWTIPTFQSGRFTKSEIFELPFMVNSAEKGSQALWDYIQKNSLDELKGAKIIFTHVHDGSVLHFRKMSVKNLEDLKGLKISSPGRLGTKAITALGAIPVQMPVTSLPEALSKGVVDGGGLPWEVTSALKLQEICKTHTEFPLNRPKIFNATFVFAMNQAKYNSLPTDLKKVIDNNSGREVSKWVGKIWDAGVPVSRKVAVDHHNTINVLSEAEYQRWVKATDVVNDEWIKMVNAKGFDGKALYNDAKALLKKYHD